MNLRRAPIDGPDELAAQHTLAVDDVGLGKLEGSVKVVALLVGIAHGEQVDVVLFEKILVGALVGVDADRHHLHTLALHLLLHLHQRRHFFDAGRTPGGPEIQHHHFAAKFVEADFAVGVLNREAGGGGTDVGRAGAAVTTGQRQKQGQDAESRPKHVAQSYNS